jgi:hypothetical protein
MRVRNLFSSVRGAVSAVMIITLGLSPAFAQSQAELSLQETIRSLQQQMTEMKSLMEEMRADMMRSHAETLELRQTLEAARGHIVLPSNTGQAEESEPIQRLEEEQELLKSKVDEQYQTKVESASKYRVRLSGMVLLNLFNNRGSVDNVDFPVLAWEQTPIYYRSNVGASLRQSLFGLEVFGPEIRGARVSADAQFDFAGGFPDAPDGVTFGLPRLRTAGIRMAWAKTTLFGGQDAPFFSPLSPTTIASVAVPGLSYSGNLWTWTPQVRAEHRIGLTADTNLLVQGGILDPLTGERPVDQFFRKPQAGEASRQPAYATRVAWNKNVGDRQLTAGFGSYYSRQDWGFYRNLDAWAGTFDWTVPLSTRFEFTGELYRGRGIGGLGGGLGGTAVFSGPLTDPATRVRGVNSSGGWAQVKFRQNGKLEWNGAFGQDDASQKDLSAFPVPQQGYLNSSIARNRGSFVNLIYRPRSDVLFSVEYRRLRTFMIGGDAERADQLNWSMGVLF